MSFVYISLINLEELQLIILQRAKKRENKKKNKEIGKTDVTDKINGTDKTSEIDGIKEIGEADAYETSGI